MFIIKTELDDLARDINNIVLSRHTSDINETRAEQYVVPLEPAVEMDWFNLADENEFALSDLNNKDQIENYKVTTVTE